MDKTIYYNELFSIYKVLLTEKEKNIFSSYYEENNTMEEISENLNISKSAVGNTIKIVENKLAKYENKLHINASILELKNLSNSIESLEIKDKIAKIVDIL